MNDPDGTVVVCVGPSGAPTLEEVVKMRLDVVWVDMETWVLVVTTGPSGAMKEEGVAEAVRFRSVGVVIVGPIQDIDGVIRRSFCRRCGFFVRAEISHATENNDNKICAILNDEIFISLAGSAVEYEIQRSSHNEDDTDLSPVVLIID